MFVYILYRVLHLKAGHMQHNRHRLLSIMEEWEPGFHKRKEEATFKRKQGGNAPILGGMAKVNVNPMWHEFSKGKC